MVSNRRPSKSQAQINCVDMGLNAPQQMENPGRHERRCHVGTVATCVHAHCSTDCARYAHTPFKTCQSTMHALSSGNRQQHRTTKKRNRLNFKASVFAPCTTSIACTNSPVGQIDVFQKASKRDCQTLEPSVGNQHVASPTNHQQRQINLRQNGANCFQIIY